MGSVHILAPHPYPFLGIWKANETHHPMYKSEFSRKKECIYIWIGVLEDQELGERFKSLFGIVNKFEIPLKIQLI
jgi:hypothetical protein